MDFNDLANWIAVTALVPIGLFIFYYGTAEVPGKWYRRLSNRWKSTTIGKVLMFQKIVWFFFLVFVLQAIFFDYPFQDLLRPIVYGLLVVQFWVVFAALRRIQKRSYTEHTEEDIEMDGPDPGAPVHS